MRETQRIKELKHRDNQLKTQHVLSLIKEQNELKAFTATVRMSIRNGLQNAKGDLHHFNRSIGREVKYQKRQIEEAMFNIKTQRLQENQRKYNERRQQQLEHKSKRLEAITQSMETTGR